MNAEGNAPYSAGSRGPEGKDRAPLDRASPGSRGADQGGARLRRHLRELRVRRREERAGDAREADRGARGQAALGLRHRRGLRVHRRRVGRLDGPRQGPEDREVGEVQDRRLSRGEPERDEALERVARRQGAARQEAQRRGLRPGPARPAAQAQDHEDRALTTDPQDDRRAKLERLRAEGVEPFPHSFPGVVPVSTVRSSHPELPAGEETEAHYRVAGRIAARRGHGKASFIDLVDRSGRMQLHARADALGEESYERLVSLDLGDLIGVDGVAMATRRGELSLRVDDWTLLAKSLRAPPEKFHGLEDTETRYRQRELDLIANEEARELFMLRSKVIRAVRRWLDEHGFFEVETPVLQPLYGGALARPFPTPFNALDSDFYLRIATELFLKRLIVGGLEKVYELGKDFRNEGLSHKHNPEFTVLEWYEAYSD